MSRLFRLEIDGQRCRACTWCVVSEVCKVRAIVRIDRDDPPFIDDSRCYDCRLCIPVCPFGAISIVATELWLHEKPR